MKTFVIILALISFNSIFALEEEKLAIPFYLVSDSVDPKIPANTAQFIIQFSQNAFIGDKNAKIRASINGVWREFELTKKNEIQISVEPGKYQFQFYYNALYDEIITDSIQISPQHTKRYVARFSSVQQPVMLYKPVIYTYGDEQNVSIQLAPKGTFTFTYPPYQNGWKGIAHKNGSISIGTRTYPYLFWEAAQENVATLANYETGFVVKQADVTAFLERKLIEMGFNEKEKADFITFWGPIMARSTQGFAQFIFTEEYDQLATIDISPKPTNVFRVYVLWTPMTETDKFSPKPQPLPVIKREGFHVVEWGGSILQR